MTAYSAGRRADLYELEDGQWLDLWAWENRELAEEALAREDLTPTFTIWKELAGPVGFEWAAPRAAFDAG